MSTDGTKETVGETVENDATPKSADVTFGRKGKRITRQQIQNAKDLKTIEVPVPEWSEPGAPVDFLVVKMLTGHERGAFEKSLSKQTLDGKKVDDTSNIRARLMRMSVINPDGSLMFKVEDEAWLGDKGSAALDRVYEASARLSRLTKEDVTEVMGNSEATATGAG